MEELIKQMSKSLDEGESFYDVLDTFLYWCRELNKKDTDGVIESYCDVYDPDFIEEYRDESFQNGYAEGQCDADDRYDEGYDDGYQEGIASRE